MIAAGVNAKALSTFMGHASITITLDRYGHLFPAPRTRPPACSTPTSNADQGGRRMTALHVRCTALHNLGLSRGREGSTEAPTRDTSRHQQNPHTERNSALQAEGEGFEPSKDLKALNGFRDRPVQPLRHPSKARAGRGRRG